MSQRTDFMRIVDKALAFLVTLNGGDAVDGTGISDAVLALAQERDATDGTSTAAAYTAYNPTWRVDFGELDAIEDIAPIVRLDLADWPHDEFDASSDNYRQYWRLEMAIGICAIGSDRDDAIRRFLDVCSILADTWMGSGSYMGMDRTETGIERSSLTGGRWATRERNDQYLCSGFMLLRVRCRFRQSTA